MKPLHDLNPVRMTVLKRWLGGNPSGLRILDVGCGGGLVCEPLTRMGAKVTGLDAGTENIEAANAHARAGDLPIDYRATTAEDFLATHGEGRFDAVLALEIIEHVDDPALFVETLVRLCKPGGTIILSTLNRTAKSFALGIVAAEYLLRWVPRGTHSWRKFKKPSELAQMLKSSGATPTDMTGLVFDPLRCAFTENPDDVAVNYCLCATREN